MTTIGRARKDSVIKAIARLEFEDGLRTEVLPGGWAAGTLVAAAPSPGSILHHSGVAGWPWGQCGCHKDPVRLNSNSAEFCALVVLNYSS